MSLSARNDRLGSQDTPEELPMPSRTSLRLGARLAKQEGLVTKIRRQCQSAASEEAQQNVIQREERNAREGERQDREEREARRVDGKSPE
jgi:hypothetical protein